VVLVRDRCAEQGEDSVAGRLRDVALVAVHSIDHELKRRIDDAPGLFGFDALIQLHRAFDVREERGDRLALAFEGAPRCEDFVSKMLRGVSARVALRRFLPSCDERLPALAAKSFVQLIVGTAGGTGEIQSRAALGAEFSALAIVATAG
jgi:hypothetical protein